jgi:hypothetical protein
VTIASLVACWQPLSVLCFLCSPVNKSTVNHQHNTINNLKYNLHLEHFASLPTSSECYTYFEQIAAIAPIRNWTLTLNTFHPCPQLRMAHLHRTNCCHSPNADFEPLLRTLCFPAHSSEWYISNHLLPYSQYEFWTLTLNTLHPCPQLKMVHLLCTNCCHIPNTDFEPLLRTLCIPAHSSEWYTYFEPFAAIAPI